MLLSDLDQKDNIELILINPYGAQVLPRIILEQSPKQVLSTSGSCCKTKK